MALAKNYMTYPVRLSISVSDTMAPIVTVVTAVVVQTTRTILLMRCVIVRVLVPICIARVMKWRFFGYTV